MLLLSTHRMKKKTLFTLYCIPYSSMYPVLISYFYSAISMRGLVLITKCGKTVVGRHGAGKSNNNGLRLLDVCSEFSLCITNTMFQLQNKFKIAWMHPRSKHWHLIDFVIVRRSGLHDVKITRAMRDADCWTDHRLIRSQLSMRVRPPACMKQTCKRLNTNALLSEEVRGNFQRTLNHQLEWALKTNRRFIRWANTYYWTGVYYGYDLVHREIHPWRHAQATARLVRCQLEKNPRHSAWEKLCLQASPSAVQIRCSLSTMDQDSFPSPTPPARDAQ